MGLFTFIMCKTCVPSGKRYDKCTIRCDKIDFSLSCPLGLTWGHIGATSQNITHILRVAQDRRVITQGHKVTLVTLRSCVFCSILAKSWKL